MTALEDEELGQDILGVVRIYAKYRINALTASTRVASLFFYVFEDA